MNIGLDFDETVTADPVFWSAFVGLCKKFGHSVTIVTFRSDKWDNSDIEAWANQNGITRVVYTAGQQKSVEAPYIDVWIDDMPVLIPHIAELKSMMIGCEKFDETKSN
jgi:hypothetical protein